MLCTFSSLGKQKDGPNTLTVVQLPQRALFNSPGGFIEPVPSFKAVPAKAWMGILYVALFVTVIPFLIQTVAQRYSPEIHAAVLLSLESPSG